MKVTATPEGEAVWKRVLTVRVLTAISLGVLVVTGCSGAPSTNPSATEAGEPSLRPSDSAPAATSSASPPAPSPTATGLGDTVAAVDPICRDSFYRDAGALTVAVVVAQMVTIVYTDPEGDFVCQWLPRYGSTAVVQGGFEHHAAAVSAVNPLVVDGNQSWTGETGTYVWGAIGPEVAAVLVDVEGLDEPLQAAMADGYFLAVLGPDLPCCVFTARALDAGGAELARYP
jgi:hypothetical protein